MRAKHGRSSNRAILNFDILAAAPVLAAFTKVCGGGMPGRIFMGSFVFSKVNCFLQLSKTRLTEIVTRVRNPSKGFPSIGPGEILPRLE